MSLALPSLRMGPVEFRRLLERLGPTFIKVGQYLALRPDLVAQEYCDELLLLLDRVAPFPWPQARAILAAELGRDPYEVFAVLSPQPAAAGSLAQVHVGCLKGGEEVAVKILRPGIAARVEQDLRRMRLLARLLEVSGGRLVVSPREVVAELGEWMAQEIDLKREASNLERMHRQSAGEAEIRIPRPFPAYCTSRVLVAEYLRGVPLNEVLRSLGAGEEEERRRVEGLGVDPIRLAENLVLSSLRQMFRHRFFHADLHPGNLLVLNGDVLGFVDFGLCAELDPGVREGQLRYLSAVASGNTERIFRAVSELLIPGEETDVEAFRRDFLTATRRLEFGAPAADADGAERSPVGRWLVSMMRAARRNDLQVPAGILALYRALLTVETVAHHLGLEEGLRVVGRRFFARLQQEEALQLLEPDRLQQFFLNLLHLSRDAPGQLNQLLAEVAEGTYVLKVTTSDSSRLQRARNRRARLTAAALLSVGVALLLTRPEFPSVLGVSLAWPLAAGLLALYGVIVVLWRRLD